MIEAGEIVQVGVNAFTGEIGLTPAAGDVDTPDYAALERERIESLAAWRARRDNQAVEAGAGGTRACGRRRGWHRWRRR